MHTPTETTDLNNPPSVMSAGFKQKPQGVSFIMDSIDEESVSI